MRTCKRIVLFWAVLAVGGTLGWNASTRFQPSAHNISFSQFLRDVDSSRVRAISMRGDEIVGENADSGRFTTIAPRGYVGFVNRLIDRDVDVSVVPEAFWSRGWAPWAVMFILTQLSVVMLTRTRSLSYR